MSKGTGAGLLERLQREWRGRSSWGDCLYWGAVRAEVGAYVMDLNYRGP